MPMGSWLRIALAAVVGVGALVLLAGRQEAVLTAEHLGVLLFAACFAYAIRVVDRHFDARERGDEEEGR
ncbi:hypothetical protein GCM10010964_37680 [Caldovatus sediminis]|uniref:Uncharacterized protein n=1 Tax=Caldovatus sediminis TaxID=2041189 RepID=A0A8J2ZF14_9PROT|nr:hypothetical protein [Caldovatus sediminis]GGG46782.1 hypothetical protein GCM10010964_37680 [Caldovatus sediminis]